MSSFKVVCLISGGKDSLFSILHCLQNGHEVVALANLFPRQDGMLEATEDLDSYMYQTVGHTVLPLYEQALGLPLYRQEILGSAVNQSKCYGPTDGEEDETEILVPLLNKVKARHPEVNAVSTGAILSDYQRTRVESVAVRLGLTPLSYLWQWPNLPPHTQKSLLEDMATAGQDSRIIKVASGGLDDSFLWQNVAEQHTIARLDKAVSRFGAANDGAILGEGGEYETLAVAGPPQLWKGRIVVAEHDRRSLAGEAGSASVKVLNARLVAHSDSGKEIPEIRTPRVLEPQFQSMLESLEDQKAYLWMTERDSPSRIDRRNIDDIREQAGHTLLPDITGEGSTAADQMQSIMQEAIKSLQAIGHSLTDVAYTSIILRDMADFWSINAVYGSYFVHPNPPSRVTIACSSVLPPGRHIMISMTSTRASRSELRKGLHVQSRSYWAPANIGPYSQAISIPMNNDAESGDAALIYVAGQIPLVPASMDLPASTTGPEINRFIFQTVLALQHVVRIGRTMLVKHWACAIAFVSVSSSGHVDKQASLARRAWEALHRSEELSTSDSDGDEEVESDDFDVWHIKHGRGRGVRHQQSVEQNVPRAEASTLREIPPLHVVLVDSLPRGSSVEWVAYGLSVEIEGQPSIPHFLHLLQVFRDLLI